MGAPEQEEDDGNVHHRQRTLALIRCACRVACRVSCSSSRAAMGRSRVITTRAIEVSGPGGPANQVKLQFNSPLL
jgi:hypothetical protein